MAPSSHLGLACWDGTAGGPLIPRAMDPACEWIHGRARSPIAMRDKQGGRGTGAHESRRLSKCGKDEGKPARSPFGFTNAARYQHQLQWIIWRGRAHLQARKIGASTMRYLRITIV
jgi:hypothetical protein